MPGACNNVGSQQRNDPVVDECGPVEQAADPHLDAGCVKSYHDPTDANSGGPHSAAAFKTCFDDGKMDGFIKNAEGAKTDCAAWEAE